MNLYYLAQKHDSNLVLSGDATLAVRRVGSEIWRGFDLAPSAEPQIRLRRATAWHPFRGRPESIGWYATAKKGKALIRLAFTAAGDDQPVLPQREDRLDDRLSPVSLPWALSADPHSQPLDLVLNVPVQSPGPVFLGIHKALNRQSLLDLCKGRGVEIGPGPKPQVLPSRDVEVTYVEQMPPDEWRRLYGVDAKIDVDPTLWDRYVVGDAHDLPVPDGSLDFIFSSHVFEHLANPLGHLQVWGSKLRKGGRIVAVIPDHIGSKDYASNASDLREMIAEYKTGVMEPTAAHYARFARSRGIADDGAKMHAERRSIHVHFYSHANMALLMEEAVRRFGFQDFSIIHTPNHKDFYVVAIR